VGFLPGFPYLLGLDERLHMPRLTTPRGLVAAGSVGIGGSQTGVYPAASPGGWRLIGTALMTFAPDWIEAGDIVVFRAVGGVS
jgi:KipI family sensor histidine kinase inhibitor